MMLQVTAISQRFTRNVRKSEPGSITLRLLTEELTEAEKIWIKAFNPLDLKTKFDSL